MLFQKERASCDPKKEFLRRGRASQTRHSYGPDGLKTSRCTSHFMHPTPRAYIGTVVPGVLCSFGLRTGCSEHDAIIDWPS